MQSVVIVKYLTDNERVQLLGIYLILQLTTLILNYALCEIATTLREIQFSNVFGM